MDMTKVLKECLDHQTVLYWTKKTPMIHSDKSRFHIWSENKKVEVVKVLIKHPAINVNVKDKDGLTEIIWHKKTVLEPTEKCCAGIISFKIVASCSTTSADFWCQLILYTATFLKEMRIVQLSSWNERTLIHKYF